MSHSIEDIIKLMRDEKFKKSFVEHAKKNSVKEKVVDSQIDRLKSLVDRNGLGWFGDVAEKLVKKYTSQAYYTRHTDRGHEPPCSLYSFLLKYAHKYGREATQEEFEKFGNDFTGSLYFIHGHYVHLMHGQGSVVDVIIDHGEFESDQFDEIANRIGYTDFDQMKLNEYAMSKVLIKSINYIFELKGYDKPFDE